ncbi:flagellin N-terminal helical region, partial [Sphingomonas sp. NFR04]|uniref:flagellin n=1 Tax=Sphingomonas sp. NFR04 TaxID=1566283 RepID=UPI0008E63669
MAFSVNTNVGAMAALQSLTATQKDLSTTQNRINTGLSVSSTKDDSASYTIAQGLRGDLGGLKAVSSSLSRAKSVTDVAVAGAEQISDIVNQMQAKARQSAD